MAGVLAAAPFRSTLTGDGQLLRRPMDRVAVPLRLMGADVDLRDGTWPPVRVQGGSLAGIEYRLPVASAQVKSAILLAGVQASGETAVMETVPARDHTERLLARAGACVERRNADGVARTALRGQRLDAFDISIPGDLSSAAPLLAAAAMMPGSDLTVEEIGLNPTRIGFLTALRGMGGSIETSGAPPPGGSAGVSAVQAEEPGGSVRIRHAPLRAIAIGAEGIPALIDELPLLALVATQAEGVTEVRGAAELRVKESDRIAGLVAGLRSLGAEVEELEDGFTVRGPTPLRSGVVDGLADHRLAMTFAVAGLVASGPVGVEGMGFVSDSFPGFHRVLEGLR
jgi:3-phosphoshikimate 1-carboxyvinyltransferase